MGGDTQAVAAVMSQIRNRHGNGALIRASNPQLVVQFRPTGIASLDAALGGGFAQGRIVEIVGPEASGKTTLTLAAIAAAQKRGEHAAFIDMEHAFDIPWAQRVGVDTDQLLFSQPGNAEQGLEILEQLVRSSAVGVIVLDSTAALVQRRELEGNIGEELQTHGALMSQALRKLAGCVNQSGTTVIFTSQLRRKTGSYSVRPNTPPAVRR